MADLARRFSENPLLTPRDVTPSRPDLAVECLLNPGAFEFRGRIGLLLRVAERPVQEPGWISTPILNPQAPGGIEVLRFRRSDPKLKSSDPRLFEYDGASYLTTLSHLRLAWSDDGCHFTVDPVPTLIGQGPLQSFGLEDVRVARIAERYYLTYTVVSRAGVAVGLSSTDDWRHFEHHGVILPPHNKDCALFTEKAGGWYWALHRPSGVGLGGNHIWIGRSPDLLHWGAHRCLAMTRPGAWDEQRVGAGAAPICTAEGWLEIYHGANHQGRYCLGALLLEHGDPTRLLARAAAPIMEPAADYELQGFFGNVIFTNGHIVTGDRLRLYYGASDSVICGADLSLAEVLKHLQS